MRRTAKMRYLFKPKKRREREEGQGTSENEKACKKDEMNEKKMRKRGEKRREKREERRDIRRGIREQATGTAKNPNRSNLRSKHHVGEDHTALPIVRVLPVMKATRLLIVCCTSSSCCSSCCSSSSIAFNHRFFQLDFSIILFFFIQLFKEPFVF
jgi:hypothetical protein